LSFNSAGLVDAVLVDEGDAVAAGQVLARLDSYVQFQAQVSAAELQLAYAQQSYDSLFDNLDFDRALALKAVADGRDHVRAAERYLTNLNTPTAQADIDQARANLVIAEDKLEKAKDAFEPYKNKPEDNLIRAALQSNLAQAQNVYDAALRLVNNLEGNASEIDLAQAEADLAVAQAALAAAERDYEQMGGGPHPDALEIAQAQLENAKAQLAAAEDALAHQEIRAPFAGSIVLLNIKMGEFVTPGVIQIVLADLSSWQVETTDLAESDVALLRAGDSAIIILDAFPGVEFSGTVLEVGLLGEDRRGAITYPVVLSFDAGEAAIRWEMTAFVDIEVQ
ncbi:MAG: efflux RND transporter periplasmic adaptor subunit, partial [Anaerolineae bacterium]|nr:efflux RND transporter periplasmic adaptor subunit [Anaerolineae bacterium]